MLMGSCYAPPNFGRWTISSAGQWAELDRWSRAHPKPGMRLKTLAIRAVAQEHTRQQVGAVVRRAGQEAL